MTPPLEFGLQKDIDTIKRHRNAGQALAKGQHVCVIMFTAQARGGRVTDQRCPHPGKSVDRNGNPDATATTATPRDCGSSFMACASLAP
jgi:hypothetical protein